MLAGLSKFEKIARTEQQLSQHVNSAYASLVLSTFLKFPIECVRPNIFNNQRIALFVCDVHVQATALAEHVFMSSMWDRWDAHARLWGRSGAFARFFHRVQSPSCL